MIKLVTKKNLKIDLEYIFKKLLKKEDLNSSDSQFLVKTIFNEQIDNVELSSILTLLNIKNESFEEIFAFAKHLKKKAKKISLKGDLMDTCGTGGDNKNSFNFSTAVSILLSTFNIKMAKHGNRSVTSKSGSTDVLQSLGIKINLNIEEQKKFFNKHGICFLFAPNFHGSLRKVSQIRALLPFKTIFNLLGPLLNPSKLKYQLLGVSSKSNLRTHAKCLKEFNIKKAWVVYNLNGYDELTTTSSNKIIEVQNKRIFKEKDLNPTEIGLKIRNENELKGGTPDENAFIMKRLFEGETGAIRDNVILNTAAGLVVSNKVKNLNEGLELARKNIDNGLAQKKLLSLINY